MIKLSEITSGARHECEAVELARHRTRAAPIGVEFCVYGVKDDVSFIGTVRLIEGAKAPTHDDDGRELVHVVLFGHSLENLRVELEEWLDHHYRVRHAESAREAIRLAVRAVQADPTGDLLAGLLDGQARKRFESLTREQQRHAMDPKANHL